jgi:hypothetical protein
VFETLVAVCRTAARRVRMVCASTEAERKHNAAVNKTKGLIKSIKTVLKK